MRSGNDPGRFRETMHWVRVGATLAVLVLAVVGIRSCVSERGGVHAPTPEERLAAAAERTVVVIQPWIAPGRFRMAQEEKRPAHVPIQENPVITSL